MFPLQGSYTPFGIINKIQMVEPSLQVITSKQRPRKLSIRGNNGRVSKGPLIVFELTKSPRKTKFPQYIFAKFSYNNLIFFKFINMKCSNDS